MLIAPYSSWLRKIWILLVAQSLIYQPLDLAAERTARHENLALDATEHVSKHLTAGLPPSSVSAASSSTAN